ncbi:drosomycin-like [Drosophila busckii]|uniref:drosomycin-like n=1 Tax=Drosophila busckii TaxID=30019 RepID=UPI0014333B4E|nr:drosomycin-like [Drosophila busckii]
MSSCVPKYKSRSFFFTIHSIQMKFFSLSFLFAVAILLLAVSAKQTQADCISERYRGPCAVWDRETCRRVCIEESRPSGYCTASLRCMCEGC